MFRNSIILIMILTCFFISQSHADTDVGASTNGQTVTVTVTHTTPSGNTQVGGSVTVSPGEKPVYTGFVRVKFPK